MPPRKEPKRRSLFATFFRWFATLSLALLVTFVAGCYLFLQELNKELPDIHQLQSVQYQTPLDIYSQDGLLIAEFGENRRLPVTIEQIPQQQINAFLAAEDDRFYQHYGVDPKGLLRAGTLLATTGKRKQGGSTITMQVARNFLLSNEKTYLRKLKEIMLAVKIERNYSKQQILELYLNKIYMGQRAYGVAAAAQIYYGKELADLELQQQAMIAGLPKAPSQYNPIADPERALQRRNYILRRMLDLHYIDQSAHDRAVAKPDDARIQNRNIELYAPYIAELVRQEMLDRYGEETYNLGLKVYTTIPGQLQAAADHAVQQTLHEYDERHEYRGLPHKSITTSPAGFNGNMTGDCLQAVVTTVSPDGIAVRLHNGNDIAIPIQNIAWSRLLLPAGNRQKALHVNDIVWVRQLDGRDWALAQIPAAEGALVALDPKTGAILALSGGFDFFHSKYNRATQTKRQPGSGFKPIIYTAALEKGYTAASVINDAPLVIEDPSLENGWRPENYTQHYHGPTLLRVALRESINMVSIRLLQEIGISQAIATAMRFGFDKAQLPRSLSLALGSGSASPLNMAEAYAVFANGGFAVKPYLVEQIRDRNGDIIYQAEPATACPDCAAGTEPLTPAPRVVSEQVNFIMNSLLRDVVARGTATRARELGRGDLAGKTGTTNEMRDAWFNGFTPDVVASAWIGFDNAQSLGKGETGGKAALPMWMAFMKKALQDLPEKPFTPPTGVVQAYISPRDGLRLDPASGSGIWEYFTEATVPSVYSTPQADIAEPATTGGGEEENLF